MIVVCACTHYSLDMRPLPYVLTLERELPLHLGTQAVSMAKDNYPNIQKCLLSASAELISRVDTYVPVTDTIIEDQWAPVVSVCREGVF